MVNQIGDSCCVYLLLMFDLFIQNLYCWLPNWICISETTTIFILIVYLLALFGRLMDWNDDHEEWGNAPWFKVLVLMANVFAFYKTNNYSY